MTRRIRRQPRRAAQGKAAETESLPHRDTDYRRGGFSGDSRAACGEHASRVEYIAPGELPAGCALGEQPQGVSMRRRYQP